jgi:hypothetical protein
MEADRNEVEGARRVIEEVTGPVLRATRRGALILETENARRMMRRLRDLRPVPEGEPDEPGPAPAGP